MSLSRFFLFIFPLILLFILIYGIQNIYSLSEGFSRVIKHDNDILDIEYMKSNNPNCYNLILKDYPIDIKSVSYSSNGEKLWVTMWLTTPINSNKYKEYQNINLTYGLKIFFNRFHEKDDRVELGYVLLLSPNDNGIWKKSLYELEPRKSNDYRHHILIESDSNYTGFFDSGNNYINMELDLESIHFPKVYSVSLFAAYDANDANENINSECNISSFYLQNNIPFLGKQIFDEISRLEVPLVPNEGKLLIEEPIGLIPGETKTINALFHATGQLQSFVNLKSSDDEKIKVKFTPSNLYIPYEGKIPVKLELFTKYSEPGLLYSNISLSQEVPFTNITFPSSTQKVLIEILPKNDMKILVDNIRNNIITYILPFLLTFLSIIFAYRIIPSTVAKETANNILSLNASIIAGVLIFLTVESISNENVNTNQILYKLPSFLTASIVIPFSLSAILHILGKVKWSLVFVWLGLIYLIISILIIVIVR
jgi:hypothetical protein